MARTKAPSGDGPLFEETPTPSGDAPAPAARPAGPRKLGWLPVTLVGGLVAAGLWGAWVTKNVLARADTAPLARVQLSGLVGEYVQAQARSATPPEAVTAELRRQVYAKVRMPQPAQANAGDVMGAMRAAMEGPRGAANVPTGSPLDAPRN